MRARWSIAPEARARHDSPARGRRVGAGLLVVAAFGARFGWSAPASQTLAVAGFVAFVLGFGLSTWAMASNRFFSGVVRIQADRGLPGYRDYALRVRHRLLPGLW